VSEREVVQLGVVKTAATATATWRCAGGRPAGGRRGELALALFSNALLQIHERVRGDLERGPLLAVAALELPSLEASLDEDAIALAEILGRAFGAIAPDADPEPVGRLDPLAGLLTLNWVTGRPFGV
jgi:hypothetical protein